MPVEDLASVHLKIDRARDHQESFERECIEFFSHEPDRAITELDENGKPTLVLVEPLPPRWGCIVGDCVQNARQALDHFLTACALKRSKKPPRIGFPITKDAGQWQAFLTRSGGKPANRLRKTIGEAAWLFVTEMQPHKRGHGVAGYQPELDVLWALNELARIDRHQTLHLTVVEQRATTIGFGPHPRIGNVILWKQMGLEITDDIHRFATAPIKNHPSFGGLSTTSGGIETKHDTYGELTFDVAFDPDSPVLAGGPVTRNLFGLCSFFGDIVQGFMEATYHGTT